jgi:hypothetical protein
MNPYCRTQLGTLYHGDSYELVSRLKPQPTILLTDPMTGQGANTQGKTSKRGKRKRLNGGWVENQDWPIMADDVPFDPLPWLHYSQIILWEANHFSETLPQNPKWIIWDKRGKETNRDDNADCEMAWTNLPGVSRVFHHLWKGICREGEENIAKAGPKLHPFQKPIALMLFCLQQFRLDAQSVVLDPFAGSGTTPAACERRGIRWIAIEQDAHFCDTIAQRVKKEERARQNRKKQGDLWPDYTHAVQEPLFA